MAAAVEISQAANIPSVRKHKGASGLLQSESLVQSLDTFYFQLHSGAIGLASALHANPELGKVRHQQSCHPQRKGGFLAPTIWEGNELHLGLDTPPVTITTQSCRPPPSHPPRPIKSWNNQSIHLFKPPLILLTMHPFLSCWSIRASITLDINPTKQPVSHHIDKHSSF